MKKKVAIVGGGVTGISASIHLIDAGVDVKIFESKEELGGLASGFNPGDYKWNLEKFYHHIFTNDRDIYDLAKKIDNRIIESAPLTNSYLNSKEIQLDSPGSLLKFSELRFASRVRMGIGLLILKLIPNGQFLEKWRVVELLPKLIGQEGYRKIWHKLLRAKFGPYVEQVNMSWFWARVAKRTKNLGYFEGGFNYFIERAAKYITENGGQINLSTKVDNIKNTSKGIVVNKEVFDAVLITTPAPVAEKLIPKLKFPVLDYLWGQTLIVELNHKLIKGYWMNILEKDFPFLVAVEHTNFVNKNKYADRRIVYLGNYLPDGDKQLTMNKDQILNLYIPFMKKINKNFKKNWIKRSFLFREPFAQPVFPTNYSSKLPTMETGINRVYLANMSMVYPYDRGTNYAVKIGKEAANKILKDLKES